MNLDLHITHTHKLTESESQSQQKSKNNETSRKITGENLSNLGVSKGFIARAQKP